jgi:hypothetical protein
MVQRSGAGIFASMGLGSSVRIADMVWTCVSLANGRLPVAIS